MILMLFAGALIIGTGCNSGGGLLGGNDPNTVLDKFLEALSKKDMEEVKKYTTKDSESFVNMMKMGMDMAGEAKDDKQLFKEDEVIIEKAVIDGDRATINVKDKKSGEGSKFILKKESGDWKVAFDKASFMEMSGEKMDQNSMQEMQELNEESLKEATDAMKNFSAEDMEKATKAMDSLKQMYEELNKDGKLDDAMKEATKMMEKMKQQEQ